ncbi:MAG TPA: DUF1206 domain-containing protein [Gaiellaceae bacterium]|jgi:hypothetical protein|nr:DUF1206 domain-containing protein [Gaiellaceae bacterium]
MGALQQELRRPAEAGRGWYAVVARVGLVAKGISYCLVGALAVKVAVGAGGEATSRAGALETLAHHAFGRVVLAALVGGFAAYALWRFVQAYAEEPDEDDSAAKAWGKRAGYAGRGLVYCGLAYSALRILLGGEEQSQDARAHHSAAVVLSWPAGTWLVGAAGVVLIGVALWNLYRGVSRKFEDKWRLDKLSPAVRRWGSRAGLAGHVARFVVFGLIGVFVIRAAVDYSPQDAIGLDGALEKLARAPYGPWLLGLTATGLVAYGAFCFVDARLRDVSV